MTIKNFRKSAERVVKKQSCGEGEKVKKENKLLLNQLFKKKKVIFMFLV